VEKTLELKKRNSTPTFTMINPNTWSCESVDVTKTVDSGPIHGSLKSYPKSTFDTHI
jgi:hypothetical protein